jgi:hypothetical protein
MNPHRKFKNHHGPDGFMLILMMLSLAFIGFVAIVLNPVHKKNIEKLRYSKPLAQHYTLKSSDTIWFYKSDEIGWTRGQVLYLWGYHPVIFSKDLNKTFQFHEVEWAIGNE